MLITSAGPRDWRKFFCPDLNVMLNGDVQKDVIVADDAAGYIVRHRRDDAGRLVIAPGGHHYATERLEGTVVLAGTRRLSPDDIIAAAQAKRARRAARNLRNAAVQGAEA